MVDWLRDIPDPRRGRSKAHELAEIFICIIMDRYDGCYSEVKTAEKNRERYEYRNYECYSGADWIKTIQAERPHVVCVGRASQVRIMQIQDEGGNDTTPKNYQRMQGIYYKLK